ncbi:MAG: YggS family pyridoxal phosphate-dependent enzyme [Cyanobacteria bacterium P01_D01_bin.123]
MDKRDARYNEAIDNDKAVNLERIAANIGRLQAQIPPSVEIMAVSKGIPAAAVRAAYAAGLRHFGESRIQEAAAKQVELSDLHDITWHLIGHLQTKKARKALQLFHWIDSLDRLDLACRLNRLLAQQSDSAATSAAAQTGRKRTFSVCLQVKLAPDPNKYGWTPDELLLNIPQLLDLSHLHIRGLMTILPLGCDAERAQQLFAQLRLWRDRLQADKTYPVELPVLSMGMSGDFQQAILAGATIVRLGRVIFS